MLSAQPTLVPTDHIVPIELTPVPHIHSSEKLQAFGEYIAKHGKSFMSKEEHLERFEIFSDNLDKIEAHNARSDRGYEKGLNAFSDLSQEELVARLHTKGLRAPHNAGRLGQNHKLRQGDGQPLDLPEEISWYKAGKYSNRNID